MNWEAELDAAARANLSPNGVVDYTRYKADLLAQSVPGDEIEQILRGFIWDRSEDDNFKQHSA